jgi:hypothetical protein
MSKTGKTYLKIAENRLRNTERISGSKVRELLSTEDASEIEEYVHIRAYVACVARSICQTLDETLNIKLKPEHLINYILFDASESRIEQARSNIKARTHFKEYNPIITIVFCAITDMHNLWVKYHQIQIRQNFEYKLLPIEYIGEKEIQRYIDVLGPILNVLGLSSSRKFILSVYRFVCIRDFTKKNLNKQNFAEALPNIITEYTAIDNITRNIMNDEHVCRKIACRVSQVSYLP